MPVATSFNALGVGNGFPFCPTKVNVTGIDYWSTFSGVTGLTATDAEISESLRLAMLFYWNSYKLNVLASFDDGSGDAALVESFDSVDDAKDASSFPVVDADELSPKSRVCRSGYGDIFRKFETSSGLSNTTVGGSCRPSGIVALYAGDTGNYDNFIGYGFDTGISITESNGFTLLYIDGYTIDRSDMGFDVDYCSIPIVGANSLSAVCSAFGNGAATSAKKMTAAGGALGSQTTTLQMKTIDCYTYP